ncbi:MAG: sulfite exporter TauE/SafE family protein [Chloroflexi bacterium]|nr:sulfite exporter TauE/SafE family protein [Chloroflexota bacterium]
MAIKHLNTQHGWIAQLRQSWPLWLIGLVVVIALGLFALDSVRPDAPAAQPAAQPAPALPEADAVVAAPPVAASVVEPVAAPMQMLLRPEVVPDTLTMDQLLKGLLRQGIRPEGVLPTVDVLLSAPAYFTATGREVPAAAMEEPTFLFYVTEDSHEELPIDPPAPMLVIDGAEIAKPAHITVLADSYHHRTTLLLYSAVDGSGFPLVSAENRLLQLIFPASGGWNQPSNVLFWDLPVRYTHDFSSRQVALGMDSYVAPQAEVEGAVSAVVADPVVATGHEGHTVVPSAVAPTAQVIDARSNGIGRASQPLTWAAILAIMAGMLTALSPCLIQLVVYYTATLAGVSTEGHAPGSPEMVSAQRHIMRTGLFFAGGFTLVYTAGGAAAGYIGQSMDRVGVLTTWSRPLSIIAGGIIVIMAVRVAWNAKSPLICRLPMTSLFGKEHKTGVVGSVVMGISFATGCMACFSATVLPALLLYAGATGSVLYGTTLLLVFSLGVTIPCLLLAVGVSRLQPFVSRLQRAGPYLGLASAAVMAAFGVIMLTDQFHLVSSIIFRTLNLG